MRCILHLIDGRAVTTGHRRGEVYNPNIGAVSAEVSFADATLLDNTVAAAKRALPAWSAVNPQRRARVMFAYKALIERHMDELALMLCAEHGKVVADAKGDLQRGL